MNNRIIGIYLEIKSSCKENCIYCYNENALKENNSITLKLFDKMTNELRSMNVSSLSMSGGEPFMHPQICELILNAINKNILVSIVTNGTIYKKNLYELICKYSIPLQITLDGADTTTHDYTRGENTFLKIMENISTLHKMGYDGPLSIRMNLHKKNYFYIKEVVRLSEQLEATNVSLSLINTVGGGKNFDYIITDKDFEILSAIERQTNELKNEFKINIIFEGTATSIGCPYYGRDNILCGLRISSDGYVYPCQLFNDKIFNIGNIKNESLVEIINGEAMTRFLSLMSSRKYFIPECNECAYKCMCNTGCPAEAYNKNQNIFTNCGKCFRNKKVFNKTIYKIVTKKTTN